MGVATTPLAPPMGGPPPRVVYVAVGPCLPPAFTSAGPAGEPAKQLRTRAPLVIERAITCPALLMPVAVHSHAAAPRAHQRGARRARPRLLPAAGPAGSLSRPPCLQLQAIGA